MTSCMAGATTTGTPEPNATVAHVVTGPSSMPDQACQAGSSKAECARPRRTSRAAAEIVIESGILHRNRRSILVGQANFASTKGDWQLEMRATQQTKRQSLAVTALIACIFRAPSSEATASFADERPASSKSVVISRSSFL